MAYKIPFLILIYDQYNTVIVGKFFNLYSRISKIIETKLNGKIIISEIDNDFIKSIENAFLTLNYKAPFLDIINWLNSINLYIQETQPWKEHEYDKLNSICNYVISNFKQISYYFEIICPHLKNVTQQINYSEIKHFHLGNKINFNPIIDNLKNQ